MPQPPGIYRDHNNEQRKEKQQIDCLQHFYHAFRFAAVQIIDIKNNPLDWRRFLEITLSLVGHGTQDVTHRLKIRTDMANDAEVLSIGSCLSSCLDQSLELALRT